MNITEKIDKYLDEKTGEFVDKGIYNKEGKKVMGERPGWLILNARREDDTLKQLTWKQFKQLKVPFKSSDHAQDNFIKALLNTVTNFGRKVDYNSWIKREGSNASFEEKVDKIMSLGAKLPKKGLKA